jgi:hypothetical protein
MCNHVQNLRVIQRAQRLFDAAVNAGIPFRVQRLPEHDTALPLHPAANFVAFLDAI